MKRAFGLILIVGFVLAGLSPLAHAQEKKKVLFLTKSSGFQHSVITRDKNNYDKLAWAEQILTDIGAKNGFEVTCTKDGSLFKDPATYQTYDVFAFYTTGDLRNDSNPSRQHVEKGMGQDGMDMLLKAIAGGKGFIAFHCGSDTMHSPSFEKNKFAPSGEVTPYIQMLGGEFLKHQSQQASLIHNVGTDFPGLENIKDFTMTEEWYSLKNFQPDIHVLMVQETGTMKTNRGVKEEMYQRPPYPETWVRMDGKGRVFYTSMGHREDVWTNPTFQQVTIAGLNWVSGKTSYDPKPNIEQAAPGAETVKK